MKNDFMQIESEDPANEVWRRLKRFYSPAIGQRHISSRLTPEDQKKYEKDIIKQASQAAVSIRQAEEYFNAGKSTSVSTRPVLLYYAATSLGRALSLLQLDGQYSYDFLRKNDLHSHHGLELEKNLKTHKAIGGQIEEALQQMKCRLFRNQKGEPWGHFSILWEAITPDAVALPVEISIEGSAQTMEAFTVASSFQKLKVSELPCPTFSCSELVNQVPELFNALIAHGMSPRMRRAKMTVTETRHIGIKVQGKVKEKITERRYAFWVFDLSEEEYAKLQVGIGSNNPNIKLWQPYEAMAEGSLSVKWDIGEDLQMWLPDMVQSIDGAIYFLTESFVRLPQFLIHQMILFILGMVARYYPDLWVPAITQNLGLSEFIDYYLSIATRVIPQLALDEIHGTKHMFGK